MDQPTVAGSTVKALCFWLAERGMDINALAREAELDLSMLEDQDYRVPLPAYNLLWSRAEETLKDPAVGLHVGEWVDSRRMGVIGHIIFNNRTLEQGLKQYVRLSALVNEGVRTEFHLQGDDAVIEYHCERPEYYHRAGMDRMLALSVTRARRFVSEKIYLTKVGFAHPAPEYVAEYERIFQCPVSFGQPCCSLAFNKDFLSFELPQRNPYLHQALTRQVEALLQKLSLRRTVSHKVKAIVAKRLSRGDIEAEKVAEKMNMSRHTLYRKLKQEDVSFQELVEQVRKDKALDYLQKGKYSLSEIAFLLGFSELSAFSRAFKRWTGESPANYRSQQ
ncbi:helix-turn-helix domain-containing protein [Hahella sp. KA22]|uniref:AraC family transcriptional regulator n=1 Tax=Hahella sp. KA22 TaxID=1628392 RepID=UPI000FDEF93B|nr:AraC family transcriptional regulator [Hahella sp. KA22]AZZ90057.1 AraC family transcriptional regulator [Hahella sp. KA22]QAY53427.1 helix-turn-helix domain-containing protein [Hahella sp. KA22]